MPDNGEVVIFEDDVDYQNTIGGILGDFGHAVVARAYSVEDAEGITEQLELGSLVVDAVLIDGNLDNEETTKQHGVEFAMRLQAISIPIIEIASKHQGFGDHSSPKNTYFTNLGKIVTDL